MFVLNLSALLSEEIFTWRLLLFDWLIIYQIVYPIIAIPQIRVIVSFWGFNVFAFVIAFPYSLSSYTQAKERRLQCCSLANDWVLDDIETLFYESVWANNKIIDTISAFLLRIIVQSDEEDIEIYGNRLYIAVTNEKDLE